MRKGMVVAIMLAAGVAVTACKKTDNGENSSADTTTVPGQDTVNVPTAVPTQDTVVKTTTTDVDTIHGKVDKDTIKK
jgi:hypothetical protein